MSLAKEMGVINLCAHNDSQLVKKPSVRWVFDQRSTFYKIFREGLRHGQMFQTV